MLAIAAADGLGIPLSLGDPDITAPGAVQEILAARPMPGTVAFTAAGHPRVTVRVQNSGIFSVQLPPGRYHVSGPCPQSLPVTVTAHHTTHVNVICTLAVGRPPSA